MLANVTFTTGNVAVKSITWTTGAPTLRVKGGSLSVSGTLTTTDGQFVIEGGRLKLPATAKFNNTNATTDGPNLCVGYGRDVWFRWTAPTTANYSVSTCGNAGFDTVLAAFAGLLRTSVALSWFRFCTRTTTRRTPRRRTCRPMTARR